MDASQVDDYGSKMLSHAVPDPDSSTSWRVTEGAWIGLTQLITRLILVPPPSPPSYKFGILSFPTPPPSLSLLHYFDPLIAALSSTHPSIQSAALNFLKSCTKRLPPSDLSSLATAIISSLTNFDDADPPSCPFPPAVSTGFLSSLSVLSLRSPPSVRPAALLHTGGGVTGGALLPFLSSPASTVRQAAAELIARLGAPPSSLPSTLAYLNSVSLALAPSAVDTTPVRVNTTPWQLLESTLLSYQSLLLSQLTAHLLSPSPSSPLPSLPPALLSPPLLLLARTLAHTSSSNFEVRRAAAMLQATLAKVLVWSSPSSLRRAAGEPAASPAYIGRVRAALEHAASLGSRSGICPREVAVDGHGIQDGEDAAEHARALDTAKKTFQKECEAAARATLLEAPAWAEDMSATLASQNGEGVVAVELVEVCMLAAAFTATNAHKDACADAVLLLQEGATVVMPAGGHGEPTPAAGDKLLLASVARFIVPFCAAITDAATKDKWAKVLTHWLTKPIGTQTMWPGTSTPVADVRNKLLSALRQLASGAGAGACGAILTALGAAVAGGTFGKDGGGVTRSMCDVLVAATNGLPEAESALRAFFKSVVAASGATPTATASNHAAAPLADRFKNIQVKTGIDDVLEPLPTTPDKTPKMSGPGMPPLPPTPAVKEKEDDWDDWDEESEEDDWDEEDGGGGAGGAGWSGGVRAFLEAGGGDETFKRVAKEELYL